MVAGMSVLYSVIEKMIVEHCRTLSLSSMSTEHERKLNLAKQKRFQERHADYDSEAI